MLFTYKKVLLVFEGRDLELFGLRVCGISLVLFCVNSVKNDIALDYSIIINFETFWNFFWRSWCKLVAFWITHIFSSTASYSFLLTPPFQLIQILLLIVATVIVSKRKV